MSDDDVPVECRRLFAELRETRRGTGLSLAALAERTAFSKSSWERYLNGKKMPPRQAVEALARVARVPPGRLVALWELADHAWSGRGRWAEPGVGAVSGPGPGPVSGVGPVEALGAGAGPVEALGAGAGAGAGRRGWWRGPVPVVGGVLLAGGAVVVGVLLGGGSGAGASGGAGAGTGAGSVAGGEPTAGYEPGCRGRTCEGRRPSEMGCGAAGMASSLLTRRAAGGQRLEIRYARACEAVWARAVNLEVGDRVELRVPGGGVSETVAVDRGSAEGYLATPMVAAGEGVRGVRVCLVPGGGGAGECFPAK